MPANALQTVKSTDAKRVITVRTPFLLRSRRRRIGPRVKPLHRPAIPVCRSLRQGAIAESDPPRTDLGQDHHSGGPRHSVSSETVPKSVILPVAESSAPPSAPRAQAVVRATRRTLARSGQTGKWWRPILYIGLRYLRRHPAPGRHEGTPRLSSRSTRTRKAPNFQVPDYGLVADLFEALPKLQKAL